MHPIFHKHPRLRGRDYTRGTFFVTINNERRGDILGRIMGKGAEVRMELSEVGRIVLACWNAIPEHHPHARIPEMRLMPDHLHAIMVLGPKGGRQVALREGLSESPQWIDGTTASEAIGDGGVDGGMPKGPKRGSAGAIIAVVKSESTKRINVLRGKPGLRFWDKGCREHVVVREQSGEYGRIARYITENPARWGTSRVEGRFSSAQQGHMAHWIPIGPESSRRTRSFQS